MRFDFIQDKRLMQSTGGTAPAPAAASGGTNFDAQLQGLNQAMAEAKSADEVRRLAKQQAELLVRKAAADQASAVAAASGPDAQKAVQQRAIQGQAQNAEQAAQNTTELIRKNLEVLIKQFDQSVTGLMAAEQSVEQMKAGFSGMLKVLGIACQKLGAEDFGKGCLELADALKPELVTPNEEGLRRIRELQEQLRVSSAPGAAEITRGQGNAEAAADRGQIRVEDAARRAPEAAGSVPQPTALDGVSGGSRTGNTGITATSFSSTLDRLMRGPNAILLGSEGADLQTKFAGFAALEGNKSAVDTASERMGLKAAVIATVKDPGKERQVLQALDLASGPK